MPSSAGSHPVSARKGRPQLAEHDSDREDREPDEKGMPFDEAAAWAALVAGSVLAAILVAFVGLVAKIVDRAMGGRPA